MRLGAPARLGMPREDSNLRHTAETRTSSLRDALRCGAAPARGSGFARRQEELARLGREHGRRRLIRCELEPPASCRAEYDSLIWPHCDSFKWPHLLA